MGTENVQDQAKLPHPAFLSLSSHAQNMPVLSQAVTVANQAQAVSPHCSARKKVTLQVPRRGRMPSCEILSRQMSSERAPFTQ